MKKRRARENYSRRSPPDYQYGDLPDTDTQIARESGHSWRRRVDAHAVLAGEVPIFAVRKLIAVGTEEVAGVYIFLVWTSEDLADQVGPDGIIPL